MHFSCGISDVVPSPARPVNAETHAASGQRGTVFRNRPTNRPKTRFTFHAGHDREPSVRGEKERVHVIFFVSPNEKV